MCDIGGSFVAATGTRAFQDPDTADVSETAAEGLDSEVG